MCLKYKGGIANKNEGITYGHSLNKERRKRELQRITKQNRQILQRIQESQPTYNHIEWEEEAKANDQILANISEFKPKPNTAKMTGIHYQDDDMLVEYDDDFC